MLVAEPDAVPFELVADERVRVFRPVPGLNTAFQAQCIRLLYPAILDLSGAVVVADVDLLPMDGRYFHSPLAGLDASFFVSYRDVLLPKGEIAICYNAATPKTWREVFGVHDEQGISATLERWQRDVRYEGSRGGSGWFTDQRVLYDTLMRWRAATGRHWQLDDQFTRHRRLERADLERAGAVTPELRERILRREFADFHSPVPYTRIRELDDEVVDLAIVAAGGRDVAVDAVSRPDTVR